MREGRKERKDKNIYITFECKFMLSSVEAIRKRSMWEIKSTEYMEK